MIDTLFDSRNLDDNELKLLINSEDNKYLFEKANERRFQYYGNSVFIRGLIEFTNYCKNNCYYCGIRAKNKNAVRYRLTKEDILSCCDEGYAAGLRTFVMQGGEDMHFSDSYICDIISSIKEKYNDCAVTLSIGEKSKESYKAYFDAGADRFLLRHETANESHYKKLHPKNLSLENRKRCLWDLKDIGYQVGSGFMVGSPYQTDDNIIEDLRFLQELEPDMIGIGPFLPHCDTKFKDFSKGSLLKTINLIAILRLMFPYALIPSTTALSTLHEKGRVLGFMAGANVVMPNLSPTRTREFYKLYDDKACTGEEATEGLRKLEETVKTLGLKIVIDKGNVKKH